MAQSKVTLHYFELGSLGRGEVVRLFLHENKIAFEDVKYEYGPSWRGLNKTLGLSPTGSLPILDIDGHKLSQHIPILRYLARKTNSFDGESNYEKYLVDAVSDIYIDWRAAWANNLSAKAPAYAADEAAPRFDILAEHYSEVAGPYLLGEKATYVDFAVYQAIDNEGVTGGLPNPLPESLAKLKTAIEARPNLKEYILKRSAK